MTPNLLILSILIFASASQPSQQPVIGIYTQDAEEFSQYSQVEITENSTYIAASYIKNLEMAGAQVVPIFYHYSNSQIESLLGNINGVFFPGGEMPIVWGNEWLDKTALIFNYAKKQNDLGNVYPVWATCLGYEAVMYITSGRTDNTTVFTHVTGQDGLTCPLFVKNSNSKLLKTLSEAERLDATTGSGLFFFHHSWTVMLDTYNANSNWTSFWNLISTSKTIYGQEFLSTLEAKDYPFYLTQYHPEKNSYEWRIPASRTYNAVSAAQKFINLFVNEARKNKNKALNGELDKKLIYNYQPVLTPLDYSFVQVYVFDERRL